MDRNTFVLWTTDRSAVFNASPELVCYVAAPAGTANGDWCLVDLDAVSRDPLIKLRNDKLAWRVMNVLIGGDFVDGLPGIGPTRLNRQEDLVELCNSFAALSAGGVEQLLKAALAKAASPYPDIIINGLKKETIEHVRFGPTDRTSSPPVRLSLPCCPLCQ